jgi:hypothetical protein
MFRSRAVKRKKFFFVPFGPASASEKLKRGGRMLDRAMRVCIGHIHARCENCGGQDFQPSPGESSPAQELVCFSCGAQVTRRALLMQIADETVKRAQAFIELSKKARSQPRGR